MRLMKKITNRMSQIGLLVGLLFWAGGAHAYYIRADWIQEIMRYKITETGGNTDFDFVNSYTVRPDPSGIAFGIGDYFATTKAEILLVSSNRRSDTFTEGSSTWQVSAKKTAVAMNIYKDFVKQNILSAYYLGSIEYAKLKPTIINITHPASPVSKTLTTQSDIVVYFGLGGQISLTPFMSLDFSGKVGYPIGKSKTRNTTLSSASQVITTKPGVLYGIYGGLVFAL